MVVATDTEEIVAAVRKAGGEAVLTAPTMPPAPIACSKPSTTSIQGDFEIILNLQERSADTSAIVRDCLASKDRHCRSPPHCRRHHHLGEPYRDSNVVKVVGTPTQVPRRERALTTRATAPAGDGPLYHHFGMYAYRRSALERFVSLRPSTLEARAAGAAAALEAACVST